MTQKTIQGNADLAKQIRLRRSELGLTIEEAASRAGVGTKTWCRYEAGESIRSDKCKGVCKALNWLSLPGQEAGTPTEFSLEEYKDHEAWSRFLEDEFGTRAALSFAIGSDLLLDHLQEDMDELAAMPAGSHIGQLEISFIDGFLPRQFLMHYTYEFLYHIKCSLYSMRTRAQSGLPLRAHSVAEELLVTFCEQEASALIELSGKFYEIGDETSGDWIFDLFGDSDLLQFLYSGMYLEPDHPYHLSHWYEPQFYME